MGRFSISENERLKLERARAEGRLKLPNGTGYQVEFRLADGSRFPRTGRINFADTRINPQTGTFEMRATVPNADGALKPGQFMRVVLKGAERPDAIAVPQVAVMEGPQGKFVYVAGKNEKGMDVATPRPVVAGDWTTVDGRNLWIVDSGLKPGDVGHRRRHREADAGRADQACGRAGHDAARLAPRCAGREAARSARG